MVVWEGGTTRAASLFNGPLVMVGMYRIEYTIIIRDMRDWLGFGACRPGHDTVRGECSTECMLYSVYAPLEVNSLSWHGESERDDLTLDSLVIVEVRARNREMRGYRVNHHQKQGHGRVSCGSRLTIP